MFFIADPIPTQFGERVKTRFDVMMSALNRVWSVNGIGYLFLVLFSLTLWYNILK